jgi:hypothetical protein
VYALGNHFLPWSRSHSVRSTPYIPHRSIEIFRKITHASRLCEKDSWEEGFDCSQISRTKIHCSPMYNLDSIWTRRFCFAYPKKSKFIQMWTRHQQALLQLFVGLSIHVLSLNTNRRQKKSSWWLTGICCFIPLFLARHLKQIWTSHHWALVAVVSTLLT